jgi:hypothetical protein
VCDACLKTEHPEKCTHKMSEIPRWISSKKVEVVRTLLADDPVSTHSMRGVTTSFLYMLDSNALSCASQAMLLRETLGISADGSEKMYRDDETTAFEQRKADPLVWIDRDHRCVTTRVTIRAPVLLLHSVCSISFYRLNVMHFFVAVDPSGGGASAFSICSCLTMPNGSIQVPPTKNHSGTRTRYPSHRQCARCTPSGRGSYQLDNPGCFRCWTLLFAHTSTFALEGVTFGRAPLAKAGS